MNVGFLKPRKSRKGKPVNLSDKKKKKKWMAVKMDFVTKKKKKKN